MLILFHLEVLAYGQENLHKESNVKIHQLFLLPEQKHKKKGTKAKLSN